MGDLTIPEEAIERACVAMNDGVWTAHHRERWGAQIELILAAAAPLIVAAELERLVDETDWAWAVGSSLRARASVLRREER